MKIADIFSMLILIFLLVMALQPYRDEELNFFKFTSIVLNEFPKVLRQTFKTMWDTTHGHCPSFQLWDDSTAVRNMFAATEGGGSKVPTHRQYSEWDCTALFQATIYARSFASHGQTLNDLYLKPHGVPHGSFHASVVSPTGNDAETFALSIDQLRLLRNWLCHSSSSEMEKTTFDQYVQYAKDAFKALGASTALIDAVENLTESDFPTNEIRKLEKGVKEETRAYMAFLESVNSDIMEIRSLSAAIKEKVESDTATKNDVALLEQKIDERERILEELSSDISEIKQKDKEFMDKLEEKISELRTAHDERNSSNTNSGKHITDSGNRAFPSSPGPLFQNEGWCSAFDMEIIFHSHANKTHFHRKGCATSLILKVWVFGTRKGPIVSVLIPCN